MGKHVSAYCRGFHGIATVVCLGANAFCALSNAYAEPTSGERSVAQKANTRLVAEFAIGTNGQLLLAPVRVAKERCQFAVDSGAALTVLDQRFSDELTSVAGNVGLANSAGLVSAQLFECPDLAIGAATIELPGPVACCDLQPLRVATGLPILGVLGMDFLRSQIVQIDFDTGTLRFLDDGRDLSDYGEAHSLRCDRGHRPYLRCDLPGATHEWFLLDTGSTSKTLRAVVFDRLVDLQHLTLGTQSTVATVSGNVTVSTGQLSQLGVGSFFHQRVVVGRDASESSLGIDYLSRFLVTFDFPRQMVYLSASKRHASPDDSRIIGFTLTTEDGEVRVKSVSTGGPAAEAGIEAGDVILQARRQALQGKDLFEVREIFNSGYQRSIELCLRRGRRVFSVVVTARDRFAEIDESAEQPTPIRANASPHGLKPSASAFETH